MRVRSRVAASTIALALVPVALAPATAGAQTVKPPKSGEYKGRAGGQQLTLHVSGRAVQLVAFKFPCGRAVGATALEAIRVRKGKRGYRFGIRIRASVSWSDNLPDQNAGVVIKGTFSRSGKSARGVLRVTSRRCGSGNVAWRASR